MAVVLEMLYLETLGSRALFEFVSVLKSRKQTQNYDTLFD